MRNTYLSYDYLLKGSNNLRNNTTPTLYFMLPLRVLEIDFICVIKSKDKYHLLIGLEVKRNV